MGIVEDDDHGGGLAGEFAAEVGGKESIGDHAVDGVAAEEERGEERGQGEAPEAGGTGGRFVGGGFGGLEGIKCGGTQNEGQNQEAQAGQEDADETIGERRAAAVNEGRGDGHGDEREDDDADEEEEVLLDLAAAGGFLGGDLEKAERGEKDDGGAHAVEEMEHDGDERGEEAGEHEGIGERDRGENHAGSVRGAGENAKREVRPDGGFAC